MSNNIPVITQEELEEKVCTIPNLTMAIPKAVAKKVSPVKEKKMIQKGLWGKKVQATTKPKEVPVKTHKKGNSQVKSHMRRVPEKNEKNKTKDTTNTKKKKGQANVKDDCKESVQLAYSLHIQELQNILRGQNK